MKPTHKLIHGDCLEELPNLPDNYFDSIVTDPPYGISFMGKAWDHGVPSVAIWRECYRVLKPGGYLLSFAGTRTQHRMATNIEDAGFEIRDMIGWMYGCLSEDTEILTRNGWELYHKNMNCDILVYDISTDVYKWERPERWSEYSVEQDTAYRIQSDYTDQIVSRGHRCLVERGGKLEFVSADELAGVEAMPTLPDNFSALSERQEKQLQLPMQRDSAGERVGNARSQGAGRVDGGKSQKLQSENVRGEQSSMERGGDLLQEKGQVCESVNKIHQMSSGIPINGEKGRVCNGTSDQGCNCNEATIDAGGVCASHKPRRNRQSAGESNAIQDEFRSQKIRTRPSYNTTMATVTPIEYTGVIFCPTVSTGAFVARRNGKVFVTGNSGFPKSHNISKAIDKAAGAKREDVGRGFNAAGIGESNGGSKLRSDHPCYVKPTGTTEAAKQWDGWGTALKPAFEPITVARKPLSESTVAANVMKWGTGGINVDGCRVGTVEKLGRVATAQKEKTSYSMHDKTATFDNSDKKGGRFPANLIHDGSDEVLAGFPETKTRSNKGPSVSSGERRSVDDYGLKGISCGHEANYDNPNDSGSAARFFASFPFEQKHGIMSVCKHTNAQSVLNFLTNIHLINGSIVAVSAMLNPNEQLAQNVKSAGILCDSCAMFIARSLAVMAIESTESQAIRDYITDFKSSTPHRNLAKIVTKWASTDTIPTTANLLKLFGSVLLATDANTSLEEKERAGESGEQPRFLYCPKASKQDRDAGMGGFEEMPAVKQFNKGMEGQVRSDGAIIKEAIKHRNNHPTVKPTDLMRYLCRLVTPPNGTILDPFNGSGSTGRGAVLEGFNYIGIELDAGHIAISEARINEALTTARNKAGDFTPTAKEKSSGQMNIFDMMPAQIKLRGLTADEYDETFGGDAMKR